VEKFSGFLYPVFDASLIIIIFLFKLSESNTGNEMDKPEDESSAFAASPNSSDEDRAEDVMNQATFNGVEHGVNGGEHVQSQESNGHGDTTTTTALGMTPGDLSPEHAGFYPEHSCVAPVFPNLISLPGDLPELAEEDDEEQERRQVEALLVAGQGRSELGECPSPVSQEGKCYLLK
jgi:hypothetical protein